MSLSNHPSISAAASPRAPVLAWLSRRSRLVVSLLAFLIVVVIGNANGGYYPTAWGWCVLAFAWVGGVAFLVAGRRTPTGLELAFVGALALFVGWIALSVIWTQDVGRSVLEVQRGLVYLFGVVALLLVLRRGSAGHLLGGLVAGAAWLSVQALVDRLDPDTAAGVEVLVQDRLQGALGYANGFGLLGVLGALLALGLAVHARHPAARAAAGAALPVLLTATYFTFSRGALLALAAGLIAAVAFDRRRLTLLTAGAIVAVPSAIAVWIASRAPALTSSRAAPAQIADEGGELALVLLALAIASAVVAVVVGLGAERLRVPHGVRRAYGVALACIALLAVGALVVDQGGPVELVERAYNGVNQDKLVDQATANNLNSRLGSIGTSPRVNYWRVAWDEYQAHPIVGSGAGTYEQFWLRDRPIAEPARDAHSLYLETLAELGWPGLLLLVGTLLAPLAAAVRARGEPLAGVACGAYAAYLAHGGVDWDWEQPVLTLFALACAAALLASADDDGAGRLDRGFSPRLRAVAVAAAVGLGAFSLIGLVGNRALADATAALKRGDAAAAEDAARTATRWAPWSADARRQLGRAQVRQGRQEAGLRHLREAAQRGSRDWQIWYDLGIASSGRQRASAFVKAATLNPMEDDIEVLRDQGYRLPAGRPPG